ncbi:MAG TPA: hypothetical protein VKP03_02925, partial [Patescibacteria group bacterium]|nr:hypothetical protein [Patescibacteria group bacterium]
KYKKIIVDKIIHEDGEQMASEIFPWHPIYKIGKSFQNITFIDEEIKFISDDHKIDWSANFIQLTDLFLGVVKNYFHNSSQKEHKIKITKKFLPLIERIIQNPYNFRSSYNYYNRIDINFFPKKNLQFNNTDYSTFDELYKSILRTYYKDRTSDFINRQQLPLF